MTARITWTKSTSTHATQRIYRSAANDDSSVSLLTTINDNTTELYEDLTQVAGDYHRYEVRAVTADGVESTPLDITVDPTASSTDSVASVNTMPAPDTTSPTTTLTASPASPVTGDFTVTVQFDEPVFGMAVEDITVANGTKGIYATIDSQNYTLVITPTSTPVTIDVAAGVAQDAAGNDNAAATQLSVIYNAPTAPSTSFSLSMIAGDYEFSWIAPSTDSSIVEQRIYESTTSGSYGSSPIITIPNNTTGFDNSHVGHADGVTRYFVLRFWDGTSESADSNEVSQTISDTTAPTVTLSASPASPVTENFTVTAQFSEPVTGLSTSAFNVTNGTKGTYTAIDGDTYTLVVTPTSSPVTVQLIAAQVGGSLEDAAGNVSQDSNLLSVVYNAPDTTAPTVILSTPTLNVSDDFLVTATFSEPVTGMSASKMTELDLTFNLAGTYTEVSPSVYTFLVDVSASVFFGSSSGTHPLKLYAAFQFADMAGNAMTADSNTLTINYTAPTPPPTTSANFTNFPASIDVVVGTQLASMNATLSVGQVLNLGYIANFANNSNIYYSENGTNFTSAVDNRVLLTLSAFGNSIMARPYTDAISAISIFQANANVYDFKDLFSNVANNPNYNPNIFLSMSAGT